MLNDNTNISSIRGQNTGTSHNGLAPLYEEDTLNTMFDSQRKRALHKSRSNSKTRGHRGGYGHHLGLMEDEAASVNICDASLSELSHVEKEEFNQSFTHPNGPAAIEVQDTEKENLQMLQ